MSDWKTDPKEIDEHITRDEDVSDIMTWEDLENSGEFEGYDTHYINYIDSEVAAEIPCDRCGGQCVGYGRKNDRGSYRCFSVCQNEECGNVIEF